MVLRLPISLPDPTPGFCPRASVGLTGVVPGVTHLLEHHELVLRSRALVDLVFISAGGKERGGMLSPGSPVPTTRATNAEHGAGD